MNLLESHEYTSEYFSFRNAGYIIISERDSSKKYLTLLISNPLSGTLIILQEALFNQYNDPCNF
jgi:hypothetical protein